MRSVPMRPTRNPTWVVRIIPEVPRGDRQLDGDLSRSQISGLVRDSSGDHVVFVGDQIAKAQQFEARFDFGIGCQPRLGQHLGDPGPVLVGLLFLQEFALPEILAL